MKIEVESSEVPVRAVTVYRHALGVYTVVIETPRDKHPLAAALGRYQTSEDRYAGQVIELARARYSSGPGSAPSRVIVTPETAGEVLALDEGFFELDLSRWSVVMIAVPRLLLQGGKSVERWADPTLPVDYLPVPFPAL